MNTIKRILNPVFLVGLPFIVLSVFSFHLHTIDSISYTSAENGGRPYPTRLIQIFSFGHLPATVDWFWLTALADPSLVHLPTGVHPAVFYKFRLVTELDPFHKVPYEAGASLLTVARKDPLGAQELLTKGIEYFKSVVPTYSEALQRKYWDRPWSLYVLLGYVELYELKNMPAAAAAFRAASQLPGAPNYLSSLNSKLEAVGGIYDVGLQLLDFMARRNPEPTFVEQVKQEHKHLLVSKMLFHLEFQFNQFRRAAGGNSLHPDLDHLWAKFIAKKLISLQDPWGGKISFDAKTGKVVSTTPHKTVLGLD